ncbi:MAG: HEAT repeat domain-containing protein, partial [Deltaproteobacteria bacterium]|nr:HEAT repeat domain-containing protein [Deltaproteobacteria bacterium]
MFSRFWNAAIFSVPALALALAPACASRANHARSLYEAGDYAGAARAADQGLAEHPNDDGLWQMRIRAALAQGDGDALARAYAAYLRTTDDEVDKELLRDLAIATLGQALASPSAKLKITAIQAVADFELHALADQVGERLGDDNDRVAATAASAVLRGFPQAPEVADQMMSSEDAEARRISVDGIGKKVGRLALADLEKAASDRDPRVRAAAIRWLGQLKAKESG